MEQPIKNESEKPILSPFSLIIPVASHIYMAELMAFKIKKGMSYSIKDTVLEGLEILKNNNPLIKGESIPKRKYMGGKQKKKPEVFKTSINLMKKDIDWINAYILHKREENIYFLKSDFMEDLVNELKMKYSDGKSL